MSFSEQIQEKALALMSQLKDEYLHIGWTEGSGFEELCRLIEADTWISVKDKPIPETVCLIYTEKPRLGSRAHIANMEKPGQTIGGHFALDIMPLVGAITHWKPITPPKEEWRMT